MAERVERPWGWFETLATGPGYLVKRLRITADHRLSLQRHRQRSEHWVVAAGEGVLESDGGCITAGPGPGRAMNRAFSSRTIGRVASPPMACSPRKRVSVG